MRLKSRRETPVWFSGQRELLSMQEQRELAELLGWHQQAQAQDSQKEFKALLITIIIDLCP